MTSGRDADEAERVADEEFVRRVQRTKRAHRPEPGLDVLPEDLSADPLTAAWQRWDARPSDPGRVQALAALQQVEAERLGISVCVFHDHVTAGRRGGLSLDEAIDHARSG